MKKLLIFVLLFITVRTVWAEEKISYSDINIGTGFSFIDHTVGAVSEKVKGKIPLTLSYGLFYKPSPKVLLGGSLSYFKAGYIRPSGEETDTQAISLMMNVKCFFDEVGSGFFVNAAFGVTDGIEKTESRSKTVWGMSGPPLLGVGYAIKKEDLSYNLGVQLQNHGLSQLSEAMTDYHILTFNIGVLF